MKHLVALPALVLSVGALAGCGGSQGSPEDVVETFLSAAADGDYAKACTYAADGDEAVIEGTEEHGECIQNLTLIGNMAGAGAWQSLLDAEQTVEMDKDGAEAEVEVDYESTSIGVVLIDGAWYVNDVD